MLTPLRLVPNWRGTWQGGKKGVELAGCADMGGLEFFTTQVTRRRTLPLSLGNKGWQLRDGL